MKLVLAVVVARVGEGGGKGEDSGNGASMVVDDQRTKHPARARTTLL
jgi:hypothetical protein